MYAFFFAKWHCLDFFFSTQSYCTGLATTGCIANVFLQIVPTCAYTSGPTDALCVIMMSISFFLRTCSFSSLFFNHLRLEDAIMMFSIAVSSLSKREW